MKLFNTNNTETAKTWQKYFSFEISSIHSSKLINKSKRNSQRPFILWVTAVRCHRSSKPLREFTRFMWWIWMAPSGRQPSDQAKRPGLWVRQKPHAPSPFIIIIQLKSWYLFYHPTQGRRLSRPRHHSKGVQPVPKAIYRSGFLR